MLDFVVSVVTFFCGIFLSTLFALGTFAICKMTYDKFKGN